MAELIYCSNLARRRCQTRRSAWHCQSAQRCHTSRQTASRHWPGRSCRRHRNSAAPAPRMLNTRWVSSLNDSNTNNTYTVYFSAQHVCFTVFYPRTPLVFSILVLRRHQHATRVRHPVGEQRLVVVRRCAEVGVVVGERGLGLRQYKRVLEY